MSLIQYSFHTNNTWRLYVVELKVAMTEGTVAMDGTSIDPPEPPALKDSLFWKNYKRMCFDNWNAHTELFALKLSPADFYMVLRALAKYFSSGHRDFGFFEGIVHCFPCRFDICNLMFRRIRGSV